MTGIAANPALKIFVTVGTHEQGFPRLLSAIAEIIVGDPRGAEWRIQTGPASMDYPEHVHVQPTCTHQQMLTNLGWADAMISQASPGNVFTALAMTAQPIVIARRHELSEHVDDHQTIFARYLSENELAMTAHDARSISACLDALRAESSRSRNERVMGLHQASLARTRSWVDRFASTIDELALGQR
jgi:UDP-N-acetylglucosamine transferase subunit ALG13